MMSFPGSRANIAKNSVKAGYFTDRRSRAFTLLEVLVVLGILAIMLVAVLPAITSLSKSSGRKGAVSNIASIIEQTRSLALGDSRNTYVVFATGMPAASADILREYSYRAYAVFEDDATGAQQIQVTKWQKLPTGISFRSQDEPGPGAGTCITSATNTEMLSFSFSPLGATATITAPYIKFDGTGSVVEPTTAGPMRIVVFEGTADATTEVATAKESTGLPVRDEVQVGRYSGRAKYVVK
jgi:prepilin-type N-terminal cleavage/methylation domain-containing protein